MYVVRRTEANSRAAFSTSLELKIEATKASRLHHFGWNIGARTISSHLKVDIAPPLPLFEIISLEQMKSLAQV